MTDGFSLTFSRVLNVDDSRSDTVLTMTGIFRVKCYRIVLYSGCPLSMQQVSCHNHDNEYSAETMNNVQRCRAHKQMLLLNNFTEFTFSLLFSVVYAQDPWLIVLPVFITQSSLCRLNRLG